MQKTYQGLGHFNKVFVLCAICFTTAFTNSVSAQLINNDLNKISTVVIDPGHGGKDPGAIGKNSKEKDIVLAIGLLTGKYIEEHFPDIKVIYTRNTDVFIPLDERAKIANDAKADLFISIHANSNSKKSAYGTETFALGLHKSNENLEVAKKENSVIVFEDNYTTKYEGFDPNNVESYIMISVTQDIFLKQSLEAANLIQTQFRERVSRKDRGVKQAGFLVLWQTTMPSILIETGFVSNPSEEQFLLSKQGQDYLASAIFRAFRDYKDYIEGVNIASHPTPSTPEETVVTTDEPVAVNEQPEIPLNNTEALPLIEPVSPPEHTAIQTATANTITGSDIPTDSIIYKIQILYSSKKVKSNDEIFKDFNDVQEIKMDNSFKYLVGSNLVYNDAVEYSKWVKNRFPDAFIVAVTGNKIIPISEALRAQGIE